MCVLTAVHNNCVMYSWTFIFIFINFQIIKKIRILSSVLNYECLNYFLKMSCIVYYMRQNILSDSDS